MTDAAEVDAALDRIFEQTDDLFCAGKFADCDALFGDIDVACTSIVVLIGWLTATLAAREHLPSRAAFVAAIEARCHRDGVSRLDDLLRGLR